MKRQQTEFRTTQLANPFFPSGFSPLAIGVGDGYDGATPLQRALSGQLVYEATPQAAMQMIGFLERIQTDLDAELKALPPQEKKAAQGPIDALRPRLAALFPTDVPATQPVPQSAGAGLAPPTIAELDLAAGHDERRNLVGYGRGDLAACPSHLLR